MAADPKDDVAGTVPGELTLAAVVLALQGLGLLAAAVVLVVKTLTGSPDSLGRALFLALFAAAGGVGLAFAGRGLVHLRPAVRTPVVLIEILALPVGYSLGIQADRMLYGGPVIVTAVAVLYLLFTPAARRAIDGERP